MNQQGVRVATLRRDSSLSSGATARRGRPSSISNADLKAEAGAPRTADEKPKSALLPADPSVETHRVKRGETPGHIASRYATTETVLMALNGIESGESIREGQFLFVPRQDTTARAESNSASWRRYAKPPKEKGYVELSTHTARFVGLVVDKEGHLRPAAVRALNDLLGAGGKHPPLPERLIRLLVKVSNVFGGRTLHVVSGYRANSYYQDSRHRLSAAVDFTIAEVPNAVLRDYLRELDDVGVGYYPNSTFVHLDVRKQFTYWVDYSGPGESPRSSPNAAVPSRGSKRRVLAEYDALFEHTRKAIEQARTEFSRDTDKPSLPRLTSPAIDHE